jgi:hypothetical protein
MSAFTNAFELLIQERLKIFDSTIDLTSGGPADTQIIQPLLARLGTDPFEIDIKEFLLQRGKEVFPEIDLVTYDDLLINPLTIFLEPFKQQINQIKKAQSVQNADSVNTEEIQDYMANFFSLIEEGAYATGPARIYFPAPQSCNIGLTDRIISSDNLVFNPITNYTFTLSDMLFNREGNFYFVDITVQAESVGSVYNIQENSLSYTDIVGNIGVKNLTRFSGGQNGQTNQEFVAATQTALSERSFVTDRGIRANITDVRAISTIGAGNPAMQRDVIRGGGYGIPYLIGTGIVFGNWIVLRSVVFNSGSAIEFNDQIDIQYSINGTIVSSSVERVISQTVAFIFIETRTASASGECSVIIKKPGYLTLEETPDSATKVIIPDNKIHVYGHTDIFVRPKEDEDTSVQLIGVSDVESTQYFTNAKTVANSNLFAWDDLGTFTFNIGDYVSIETGASIGTYRVIEIVGGIRLDTSFNVTEVNLRARKIKQFNISLNEPKVQKLPLKAATTDLTTFANSATVKLLVDTSNYGVIIGDVFEILTGNDVGRYTIVGFDAVNQGRGPILSTVLKYTASNLAYKIYSVGPGVELPLISVKDVSVLDVNQQETGDTIPYGLPVNIKTNCCVEAPKAEEVISFDVMLLPDLINIWPPATVSAAIGAGVDARYTQKLESFDGVIRVVDAANTNPINTMEINVPPFMWNGRNNKVIGYVTEKDLEFLIDPSNNARTSPLARARKNYCLSIKQGPALGDYLIKDVRVLNLWNKVGNGHQKIAVIELWDELPTFPFKAIIDLINYVNVLGAMISVPTSDEWFKIFNYATDPYNAAGFINLIAGKFKTALNYLTIGITLDETIAIIKKNATASYKVGPAPKTTLRNYFLNPVTLEYYAGFNPTIFKSGQIKARAAELEAPVLPLKETDVTLQARDGSMKALNSTSFYAPVSPVSLGVRAGDIFCYHAPINEFPGLGAMVSSFICITKSGSDQITLVYPNMITNAAIINNITPLETGQFLFIDSGPDAGGYRIVEVVFDAYPQYIVRVDKQLTFTTNAFPSGWNDSTMTAAITTNGTKNVVVQTGNMMNFAVVNKYLSIISAANPSILTAGSDVSIIGTYKIVAIDVPSKTITLDRTANFNTDASCFFTIHDPPIVAPTATLNGGTIISNNYVRFKLYSKKEERQTISINWALDPLSSNSKDQLILQNQIMTGYAHFFPYKIIRKDTAKVISSTMIKNRENAFYYFDIDVFVINLEETVLEGSVFKLMGNYLIDGYKIKSLNRNLSYSNKDNIVLILPASFIPNNGTEVSRIPLYKSNVKVAYTTSDKINSIQNIVDSPSNRVTCSNTLVRHYLPAYTCLDIDYTSGSTVDLVSADLIDYIDSIGSVNKELRADQLIRIIAKRGATAITQPINLIAMVHDLDRNIQVIESQNKLGSDNPVFSGFNSQIYWIPGKYIAGTDPRPDGGGLFLVKK